MGKMPNQNDNQLEIIDEVNTSPITSLWKIQLSLSKLSFSGCLGGRGGFGDSEQQQTLHCIYEKFELTSSFTESY